MENRKVIGRDENGELLRELSTREKAGIFGAMITGNLLLCIIVLILLLPRCCPAITPDQIDRLIPALIQVESGGEYRAVGDHGKAVGVLQIWPVMVQDVNRIAGTRYTLSDRLNPAKSVEMARIYFRHYGKSWAIEQAARHWNSGPGSTAGTDKYWNKVRKELK